MKLGEGGLGALGERRACEFCKGIKMACKSTNGAMLDETLDVLLHALSKRVSTVKTIHVGNWQELHIQVRRSGRSSYFSVRFSKRNGLHEMGYLRIGFELKA